MKNNSKGFTLIEMVIVIVIIAILAAMLVPSLISYLNNAQEKKLITASDTIRKAIMTEIAESAKDGKDINAKSTDTKIYDATFWEAISSVTDATVLEMSSTDKAKYYVKFEVKDNSLFSISITDGKRTSTLKDNSWEVIDV